MPTPIVLLVGQTRRITAKRPRALDGRVSTFPTSVPVNCMVDRFDIANAITIPTMPGQEPAANITGIAPGTVVATFQIGSVTRQITFSVQSSGSTSVPFEDFDLEVTDLP